MTNEERAVRTAPWQGPAPLDTTPLGLRRIKAMIRFGHRWQSFWGGRDWYIGSGTPFAVVDALAAIEGRRDWDQPIGHIRFLTPLVRFPA